MVNMMHRFRAYLSRRAAQDRPCMYTVPMATAAGTVLGLSEVWAWASTRNDGYLWRPLLCGSCGVVAGVVMGIYWRESLAVMLLGDLTNSWRRW